MTLPCYIKMKNYVCIDIGGTSIKYGVVNELAEFLTKSQCPTHAHLGGPHIMETVKTLIKNYQLNYTLQGICISTAGMVDTTSGSILYASELIPNYTGTPIKQILEEAFSLPCWVENDVNCAGLSESISGAGKDSKSCICLTIGTGIGGCMIYEDKVFHGFSHTAFEIGYMHIEGGNFQDLAATTALVKEVALRKKLSSVDGHYVFENAKKGDMICNEAIDHMLHYLAMGISNLCYVINPETVILGGGIMAQKDFLAPKLEHHLKEMLLPVIYHQTQFTFAKHGNDAGMLGAFYHFQKQEINH